MQRRLEALRRLYNSVIILDRAAEADAAPFSGNSDLKENVSTLRRETCDVLTALAEGKNKPDSRTPEIDEALKRLKGALAGHDPATDLHQSRAALAFGLQEVRKDVAELVELCRDR